jgi:hypothetical protein
MLLLLREEKAQAPQAREAPGALRSRRPLVVHKGLRAKDRGTPYMAARTETPQVNILCLVCTAKPSVYGRGQRLGQSVTPLPCRRDAISYERG